MYVFSGSDLQRCERDIQLLLAIRCVRQAVPSPVLVAWHLSQGLSPSDLFYLTSFTSAVQVLAELPCGLIADGIGDKRTLSLSLMLLAFYTVLLSMGGGVVWSVHIAAVLKALSAALFSGTDSALLYRLVEERKRLAENPESGVGARSTVLADESSHVTYIILSEGAVGVLSGYLLDATSPKTVVFLFTLPALCGVILSLLISSAPGTLPQGVSSPGKTLGDVLRTVTLAGAVVQIRLAMLATLSAMTFLTVVLHPLLWDGVGVGGVGQGYAWSGVSVSAACGSWLLSRCARRGYGQDAAVVVVCCAVAVGYLLLGSGQVLMVVAGGLAMGVSRGVMWPLAASAVNTATSSAGCTSRATALSAYAALMKFLNIAIGPLIGAVLATGVSASQVCLSLGTVLLLAGVSLMHRISWGASDVKRD